MNSACPICGGNGNKQLTSFVASDVALHFFGEDQSERAVQLITTVEQLWGREEAELVECHRCQFTYALPFVSGSAEFYSLAYGDNSEYPSWKWDYEKFFDVVKTDQVQDVGNIIEIGAGNGTLINHLINRNISYKSLTAIEYSSFGVECLKKLGVEVYSKSVCDIQFDKTFDTIAMFQVLEHMDNINQTFDAIYNLSNQGANIHIAVPNKRTRFWFMRHQQFLDVPPCHISIWSKSDFLKVCDNHGFELVGYYEQVSTVRDLYKRMILDNFLSRTKIGFKIKNMNKGLLKKTLGMCCLFFYSILNVTTIFELMNKYGISSYVVLKKK
ncbi:class I SAM-dependent methyltransferase [Vibrio fluvialis]|nr:class I SAM-dependent methyltransferase [Vibrio fluvialis]MBY8266624.1 class I SAM-dependent methyltransferase [Vibrio fluvialis]